jgi:uncharacterized protein (UPF0333 family)
MHRRYRYRYINQPDTITDTISINVTYVMVKVMQRSRYKNERIILIPYTVSKNKDATKICNKE